MRGVAGQSAEPPVRVQTDFSKGTGDLWEGDLRRPETPRTFLAGADTVYHLAGEIRNPRLFWEVNAEGTENLIKVCRKAAVRSFCYLSSVE